MMFTVRTYGILLKNFYHLDLKFFEEMIGVLIENLSGP
jgi:hypothetical protein